MKKSVWLSGLTAVVVLAVTTLHRLQPVAERAKAPSPPSLPASTPPVAVEPEPSTAPDSGSVTSGPLASDQAQLQADTPTPAKAKPAGAAKQAGKGKPPPQDEMARVALSFVGADPEAEEYWIGAINDPKLSGHERQDLIEDLNEDGLSDPHHPSPQDLPLILNRLLLIEALAPQAMDQVNADAFQEAYKDLVNLADLAMGGGEPVR